MYTGSNALTKTINYGITFSGYPYIISIRRFSDAGLNTSTDHTIPYSYVSSRSSAGWSQTGLLYMALNNGLGKAVYHNELSSTYFINKGRIETNLSNAILRDAEYAVYALNDSSFTYYYGVVGW